MRFTIQLCLLFFSYINSVSQTVKITGKVYFDNNRNHTFDAGDSAYNGALVDFFGNEFHNAIADEAGVYTAIVAADFYTISIREYYNFNAYKKIQPISGHYGIMEDDTLDIVDFGIPKREDVEYGQVLIYNKSNENTVPNTSSAQSYIIDYKYIGGISNLPAIVTLTYNPLLNFISASRPPSVQKSGYLEWAIASIKSDATNSINLQFQFPAVGDTIDQFTFKPVFQPKLTGSNKTFVNNLQQNVLHNEKPIGQTKGVKWSRTFSEQSGYSRTVGNNIDTATGGNDVFIVGEKYGEPYGPYFVAKLNKEGLSIWEQYFTQWIDGRQRIYGYTVSHTNDGGCLVAGILDTSIFQDQTNTDIFAIKLNADGQLQWKKIFGGSKNEGTASNTIGIVALPDGGFLLTGDTQSSDGIFAGKHADTLNTNVFLTKLSSTGSVVWSKLYGGSEDETSQRIVSMQNGNYLLLATTESNNGDVTNAHKHRVRHIGERFNGATNVPDTAYSSEAWVINIDNLGNVIWSKCYGGSGESFLNGAAANNGGILLAGYTNSKDGDLPLYDAKGVPLWIIQISTTGQLLWSKIFPQYRGYNLVKDTMNDVLYNYQSIGYFNANLRKKKDGSFIAAGFLKDKYGEIKSRHGDKDILLVNINSTGNIIWQKAIGGTQQDEITDIILDRDENIFFVGNTHSDNDDFYEHFEEGNSLMTIGKVGIVNKIAGCVFIDLNGNHSKDANEIYYNEGNIYSAKAKDTTIARIFDGQFVTNVDTGNYVTTYVPTSNYFSVFPANKNFGFTNFDQSDSVDFALLPKPDIQDLQTSITPLTPPVPNMESSYRIITKNVGSTNISNVIISFKKDSRQSYTSANHSQTAIVADSIWWGPFTINAFSSDTLDVLLTQMGAPILQSGDTLHMSLIASPLAGDTTPLNNKASLKQIVQSSLTTNDKAEAHAGIYTPSMKASNESFQYLIRFQNTQADTVFYVTVKDTLDAKLDINSFETITASHPYKFSLKGRVATWQFDKILLVNSGTNETASNGYIAFTIKPLTSVRLGDSVTNTAAIYFDFKLPFITNKNLTALVSDKSAICPGGNTQLLAGQKGISYQWQINTGTGFINLASSDNYLGATTDVLQINNAPSILYDSEYRCMVTLPEGSKVSGDTYKLTFANRWTGANSSAWENAGNWSCGTVPDENTDVVIKAGTPNNPVVNTGTSVRSINASAGALIMVKSGVNLGISGK